MKKEIKIKVPASWRKGQTIFNFLEWLQQNGIGTNQNARLADTFHMSDQEFDEYYEEWLLKYGGEKNE